MGQLVFYEASLNYEGVENSTVKKKILSFIKKPETKRSSHEQVATKR